MHRSAVITGTAIAAAAFLGTASPARAADDEFGDRHTLAIHGVTASPLLFGPGSGGIAGSTPILGFYTVEESRDVPEPPAPPNRRESNSSTYLYLNPRIHYFVINNLSIGGEVMLGGRTDGDDKPFVFGILPTIGYNVRFSRLFSFWPQGGIGFRSWKVSRPTNDDFDNWWMFNVDLPFLFHPVPYFSIGLGPGVTFTISHTRGNDNHVNNVTWSRDDQRTTQFRWLAAHIVGWF